MSTLEVPTASLRSRPRARLFYAGVTARYLEVLGTTVLRGRTFTDAEARRARAWP